MKRRVLPNGKRELITSPYWTQKIRGWTERTAIIPLNASKTEISKGKGIINFLPKNEMGVFTFINWELVAFVIVKQNLFLVVRSRVVNYLIT